MDLNVDHLPTTPPERVIISYTGSIVDFRGKSGTIHMDLSPEHKSATVSAVAFYSGVDSPIPLNPMPEPIRGEVTFSVIPRDGQPVPVTLDPVTGEMKALTLGQALIKATLDNRSGYAWVDVGQDASEFSKHSNCKDFLPPDLSEPIDEPRQPQKLLQPPR